MIIKFDVAVALFHLLNKLKYYFFLKPLSLILTTYMYMCNFTDGRIVLFSCTENPVTDIS